MKTVDNSHFYSQSYKQFGATPQGVHWNSQQSQYKRFEILTQFIQHDIKGSTLVDAGCGFGDYYTFIKHKNLLPLAYYGLDCEDFMIKIAQQKLPEATFLQRNILKDPLIQSDYYICSGAMNLLPSSSFFDFIQRCFLNASKGFAFNFLIHDSFNLICHKEVIEFCYTLTNTIDTKEHYLYNDISFFLKH